MPKKYENIRYDWLIGKHLVTLSLSLFGFPMLFFSELEGIIVMASFIMTAIIFDYVRFSGNRYFENKKRTPEEATKKGPYYLKFIGWERFLKCETHLKILKDYISPHYYN